MVRGYPRLIERFPAYRDEALRRRFQDDLLDELCRDYDRVMAALEAQEPELDTTATTSNERQDLQALARQLEQEFLERLANYAASEHKSVND